MSVPIRPVGSFFNAPVGDLDDLQPGTIAMAGIYCDHFAGGTPGGRFAARQIRYACARPNTSFVTEGLIDLGDLNVFPLDAERNAAILTEQCTRILATGARLLTLGGDYSVSPALFAGLCAASPGQTVGLVRISRHLDLGDVIDDAARRNTATTRIAAQIPDGLQNVALLGAEGLHAAEEHEWATEAAFAPLAKLVNESDASRAKRRAQLTKRCDALFLSVDADVLPTRLSRTAHQSRGHGLSVERLLSLLESFHGLPIRVAELTGHLPDLDLPGQISSAAHAAVGYALAETLRAATP